MIDKKAYEMLVDGYANELVKEAGIKAALHAANFGIRTTAPKVGNAVRHPKTTLARANNKGLNWATNKITNRRNAVIKRRGTVVRPGDAIYDNTLGKLRTAEKITSGVVGGSGLVLGGAYATKKYNERTASEVVADIMYKEAAADAKKIGLLAKNDLRRITRADKKLQKAKDASASAAKALHEQKMTDFNAMGRDGRTRYSKKLKQSINNQYEGALAGINDVYKQGLADATERLTGSTARDLKRVGVGAGALGLAGGGVVLGNQLYAPVNPVVEKAAEMLVEAAMYKQAAFDQMENAEICYAAGETALNEIGYTL